jgi:hypothetical protein
VTGVEGDALHGGAVTSWDAELSLGVCTVWSEHYHTHARDPSNLELAPYVAKRYQRYRKQKANQRA